MSEAPKHFDYDLMAAFDAIERGNRLVQMQKIGGKAMYAKVRDYLAWALFERGLLSETPNPQPPKDQELLGYFCRRKPSEMPLSKQFILVIYNNGKLDIGLWDKDINDMEQQGVAWWSYLYTPPAIEEEKK